MTKQPKVIKKKDKPVHPDVWTIACSMKSLLKSRYPDPRERQIAAQKIMQEMRTV